jgi:hypothetical protein
LKNDPLFRCCEQENKYFSFVSYIYCQSAILLNVTWINPRYKQSMKTNIPLKLHQKYV